MSTTPCPIGDYIDYITDPLNVWDPKKYLNNRNISGTTAKGIELQFTYNYVLGSSYMTGTIGKKFNIKVQVFYRDLQGFQVDIDFGRDQYQEGFTPHRKEEVKELLLKYANS